MLVRDAALIPRLHEYANGHVAEIAAFPEQTHGTIPLEESVLRSAEMLHARTRVDTGIERKPGMTDSDRKPTVLLVGVGIMNFITAEFLVTRGFSVRIVDAGPDPQYCKDWTSLGVTHGGADARMFIHTEADNYNEKGSEIYQNMRSIFRHTGRNRVWSVRSPQNFTATEHAWVDAFERVPAWLARAFRENIYEVNREAGKLWKEYMETTPELFEDVTFCKDILRMYVEPTALAAALELTRELGTTVQATSPEQFIKAHPGFAPAAESDHLAGGFTVEGFTVNIHPFVGKLIGRITDLGGEITWNCQV